MMDDGIPQSAEASKVNSELKWLHTQLNMEKLNAQMMEEEKRKERFNFDKERRKLEQERDELLKKLKKQEVMASTVDMTGAADDNYGQGGMWVERVQDLYHEYEEAIILERTRITKGEKRIEKWELVIELLGHELKKAGFDEKDFKNPIITPNTAASIVSPTRQGVINID